MKPYKIMNQTFNHITNNQLNTKVMKTKIENRKKYCSSLVCTVILSSMLISATVSAQEAPTGRTLLGPDVTVTEVWAPEVKINSIQGMTGTLVGFYGGAMFNRTLLLGISGGVNLGHPTVNYGYFGGLAQVVLYPSSMVHTSGQVMIAYGTTKDYENPKSGLLDNFWNISGEDFMIIEPGVNLEVNMSRNVTLVTGVSYRHVTRLDANNENVSVTHVTSQEMSGVNFNIGLKFTKMPKR